jgi:hypothetical protein
VDCKTAWRTAAKKTGWQNDNLRSKFVSRANVCRPTGLTVAHLLGHALTENKWRKRVGVETASKRQTKNLTEHGQQFKST